LSVVRMRSSSYYRIVGQKNIADSSLRSKAVFNYLTPLQMSHRRYSFVCLVGPSVKSLDAMQAGGLSGQLTWNPLDLQNLGPILKKSLAEFESLYIAYKETVATIGEK